MTRRDIPPDVLKAAALLRLGGGEAFLVGGAVRDMLIGRTPGDFDLATNLLPEAAGRCFPFYAPTGIAHGTVTVWLNARGEGQGIEVTTYRGEDGYSDGRHPDKVTFKKSIEEDLARRDFTVNAIAMDPESGTLVDPYGGQLDLQAHLLRCVGTALDRFREDGLRPVRAVRFAAQLGFTLHADTEAAIGQSLDVVKRVSLERVRDELLKLLDAPVPSVGFELMRRTGLLALVMPELLEGFGLHQNAYHAYDVYQHIMSCVDAARGRTARLAALFHDIAKPRTAAPREDNPAEHTFFRHDFVGADLTSDIMRRLKFSNDEREHVAGLVKNHMFWYDPGWSDGAVRRFVGRVGEDSLDDLYALRAADIIGRGRGEDPASELAPLQTRVAEVLAKSRALKVTDLAVSGEDVMRELGLKPSRAVRDALERLLDAVLEDPSLNTPQTLLALLHSAGKTSA